MAPRPHWSGYLKLSFVSCPVSLYPVISPAERISFRQVNRKTGNRLRQQLVDAELGEPVDAFDKARGYEVGESRFVPVEDQELADAKQEAKIKPFITPSGPAETPPAEAPAQSTSRRGRLIVEAPSIAPAAAPEPAPKPCLPAPRTIEIERCVEAESAEEAAALLAAGEGHRCNPGEAIHVEVQQLHK